MGENQEKDNRRNESPSEYVVFVKRKGQILSRKLWGIFLRISPLRILHFFASFKVNSTSRVKSIKER